MFLQTLRNVIGVGLLLASAAVVEASVIAIDPSDDGSLYTCDGCNVVSDDAYVLVSGYIQGEIKFPTAPIRGPIVQALLSVNPYALPLFGPIVDVYGYGTPSGQIDASDANAGSLLGHWTLPALNFGQDAFFDVTDLVRGVATPYVAFNLRTPSGDTDVFSSLEFNYGHASRLTVTTAAAVPEAPTLALLALALAILLDAHARLRARIRR